MGWGGAGCVAIKVASKDSEKTVRTLDAGQAFGELALLKTDGRRAASVVTAMASEFLTIDGQQYQQLLGQLQREELRAKVDVLRRAPMFRYGWSPVHAQLCQPSVPHVACQLWLHACFSPMLGKGGTAPLWL